MFVLVERISIRPFMIWTRTFLFLVIGLLKLFLVNSFALLCFQISVILDKYRFRFCYILSLVALQPQQKPFEL